MLSNEFMLADRICKIKQINDKYDLLNNAYISFSGGKDSTVLHYLIDEALPGNKIPRVFINTGIEYNEILKFARQMASEDTRFVIWNVNKNVKDTLDSVGYPFKSKRHAQKVFEWRKGYRSKSHLEYFRKLPDGFRPCPKKLLYQIEPDNTLNISHLCCDEFKKKPIKQYMRESGRRVTLTGIMRVEGGQRANVACVSLGKNGNLQKFHPLAVCTAEWEDWYIQSRGIKLASLYYAPYNFRRTGCKGCPFATDLREELSVLEKFLPNERKQCEHIWKPVYDEYRRLNYRLK